MIRKQGGFIPGIRPGPPTERYLAKVLNRITLPGGLFIMVIAIAPFLALKIFNIQGFIFGGTSILITVGVMLETMKQIDSQLMMRNYEGFLSLSAWPKPEATARAARQTGRGEGHPGDAGRGALRRRAPLDGRHVPRAGGAGHRVRARSQALHGRGRARPRRDRRRCGRGVPGARRPARRRLRPRRLPAHAAAGPASSTACSAATRSTSR